MCVCVEGESGLLTDVVAHGGAGVFGAESATALKLRNDVVDELFDGSWVVDRRQHKTVAACFVGVSQHLVGH